MREVERLCDTTASVRAGSALRSPLNEIRQATSKIDGQLALVPVPLMGSRPNFDMRVGELERALAKLP